MQKYFLFSYALFSYLAAMASVTLLILWVYPWPFMPIQIDRGVDGPRRSALRRTPSSQRSASSPFFSSGSLWAVQYGP
jgi:hypothetical protein